MRRPERTGEPAMRDEFARRTVEVSAIVLGVTVPLVLLWTVGNALLVIFAGMLFAGLLDAAIDGLGRVVRLGRRLRFAIVLAIFALALAAFMGSWGVLAVQQLTDLVVTMEEELQRWRSVLADAGFGKLVGQGEDGLAPLLPDPSGLISRATTAVTGLFGLIGSAVLIVMLGIFLAYDPRRYRDGILLLLPVDKRARMREVLDEAGGAMRWWLLGIAINMTVIAAFTTLGLLLIGVPHAVVLGVQAGLFAFIPTIGPVLAAIPILLVSLGESYATLFWALALYAAVQSLESNILTPLVQMEMVRLYPGTILTMQLIMVVLFGAAGLALATPLTAVGKIFVQRLYVEDWLGDAPVDEQS